MPATPTATPEFDQLRQLIARTWGFKALRPHQEQAMRAVLAGRDSLVVMPTGGGKSLCYQAPAAFRQETTIVVSPLISLMKDQVDSLRSCGVPARQMNSSLSHEDMHDCEQALLNGEVRLLYVSPERLATTNFRQLLQQVGVRTFAIDEAHCISHWGHQFRPEYRQLQDLKRQFPGASVHAYTATATERVRQDISEQLHQKKPEVLVGNFDRPNLTYRIVPRYEDLKQVREVIDRHKNEAGIIYCIAKKDVDKLTADLNAAGYKARPYHAGLSPEARTKTQNAFKDEECDLVVATVAFGMGIDRSNIRFVLHTGMPKTIENYQQETGRAGRDGLEAECVLLYSGADVSKWRFIINKSNEEGDADLEALQHSLELLNEMSRYSQGAVCRHRALVEYFGQKYEAESCTACDICQGDREEIPEATVLAQKILSCVARVKERFGVVYVVSVLRGENIDKVLKNGHDKLSTFGLLREYSAAELKDWVHQLISQQVLIQDGGDRPILRLNEPSWEVMHGKRPVKLLRRVQRKETKKSAAEAASWEGVDRGLFDVLKALRKRLADSRQVPPYVIFSDATLRELARVRPTTPGKMKLIYGIGDRKLQDFGQQFLDEIDSHCDEHALARDQSMSNPRAAPDLPALSESSRLAETLFQKGASIVEVMRQIDKTQSVVAQYLAEYIARRKPESVHHWVDHATYRQVQDAVRRVGMDRLKPIFVELDEKVPYDDIRIVVAHLKASGS